MGTANEFEEVAECLDNKGYEDCLTNGKEYEIEDVARYCIKVKDDNGRYTSAFKSRFKLGKIYKRLIDPNLTEKCDEIERGKAVTEKATDKLWAMINAETGLSTHCMDLAFILKKQPGILVKGLRYTADGLQAKLLYEGLVYDISINPQEIAK